ncbi:MAG: hypothetical protein K8L99_25470, partial [Anaerolineae bacterium]|nr:hypothetical protein [Anaerolineae bacterium]
HGESLTARQVELLKLLYPAHLRIDLSENCDIATVLEQVWTEAEALGAEIEIALHLGSDATSRLARLRETADALQIHGRLLIFDTESPSTSHDMIKAARAAFADYPYTLPIGGGTNAYFTELNRSRPQAEALDWVAFSVNPQVHAFDNDSLVETLPILATIVDNARVIAAGKPIAVSPLTLKPRWNPSATTPVESTTQSQGLPTQVDVRQMSLFGAGWTLGSLAYLVQADSLTFFETTGCLGLMQRSEATLTDQFPAPSGVVYPMYHVFAAMAEFAGGEQATLWSSDPLQSNGLVLRKDGRLRLLLANHRPTAIKVTVSGLKGEFQLTSLDESTGDEAMHTPEVYRASPGRRFRIEGDTLLELLPYAVAKLDQIL